MSAYQSLMCVDRPTRMVEEALSGGNRAGNTATDSCPANAMTQAGSGLRVGINVTPSYVSQGTF